MKTAKSKITHGKMMEKIVKIMSAQDATRCRQVYDNICSIAAAVRENINIKRNRINGTLDPDFYLKSGWGIINRFVANVGSLKFLDEFSYKVGLEPALWSAFCMRADKVKKLVWQMMKERSKPGANIQPHSSITPEALEICRMIVSMPPTKGYLDAPKNWLN